MTPITGNSYFWRTADPDAQRMRAAHREASDCAMAAVGVHAVALLDGRHNIGGKLLFELAGKPGPEAEGAGVPVGHDDDHRFGFAGGDQVIEDEPGAAHRRP